MIYCKTDKEEVRDMPYQEPLDIKCDKARYVISKNNRMLYHNYEDFNGRPLKLPKGCKGDHSGICKGHTMNRQDFLDHYCGSHEPPELL